MGVNFTQTKEVIKSVSLLRETSRQPILFLSSRWVVLVISSCNKDIMIILINMIFSNVIKRWSCTAKTLACSLLTTKSWARWRSLDAWKLTIGTGGNSSGQLWMQGIWQLTIDIDCGDFCWNIGNRLVDLTFCGGHLENRFYVVGSLMSMLSTRDQKSIILNLWMNDNQPGRRQAHPPLIKSKS